MSNPVRLSVRALVEYVHRSGSIDTRFQSTSTLTEGTKAHQQIQKTYGDSGEKEVFLETEIHYEGLDFVIEGRCDGLMIEGEEVLIDEIKSTRGDLEAIDEDSHPVHWAQAKCYAYMYAKKEECEEVNVQLTYVQVKTGEQKKYRRKMLYHELERDMFEYVAGYAPYAMMLGKHKKKRNESIEKMAFPFEKYRPGQRKLAGAVYQTIAEGKNLFANAPTGIGKTVSTTFPSVKAMGEGLLERLFYLTAKTTTRETAEESFRLMNGQGLEIKSVSLTAKSKICFQEETICEPGYCEFANGYYDRINGAILDVFSQESIMSREVVEKYARKHSICPFEFSLDLAYAADAVICDYNYIFDPRVSMKRLFEEEKKKSALLIDEAHNLVDRGREMFSAELLKSDFLGVKKTYKNRNQSLFEAAKMTNQHFLSYKKEAAALKQLVIKELDEELITLLDVFVSAAEKELASVTDPILLDAFFAAQNLIRIAKLYDENYVTYVECKGNEVRLKVYCLDPSRLLRKVGKRFRSKIYFSATLLPLKYYHDMLGAEEEDYSLKISSPFPFENTEVWIQSLSTRYRDRGRTLGPLSETIARTVATHEGNFLVFFPSYAYLTDVYDRFSEDHPSIRTIVQDRYMSEEDRVSFLSAFQAKAKEKLVGFAVLGGVFSEGVDLKGDRLNGVIVVGVGLPQIGLERNMIREYFQENGKNGYEYAYVFPGMAKVLQAGGRLIRSEEDHGVIVLVDDRFLHRNYQAMLPDEWKDFSTFQEE